MLNGPFAGQLLSDWSDSAPVLTGQPIRSDSECALMQSESLLELSGHEGPGHMGLGVLFARGCR